MIAIFKKDKINKLHLRLRFFIQIINWIHNYNSTWVIRVSDWTSLSFDFQDLSWIKQKNYSDNHHNQKKYLWKIHFHNKPVRLFQRIQVETSTAKLTRALLENSRVKYGQIFSLSSLKLRRPEVILKPLNKGVYIMT